jgi:hypothetical protein
MNDLIRYMITTMSERSLVCSNIYLLPIAHQVKEFLFSCKLGVFNIHI